MKKLAQFTEVLPTLLDAAGLGDNIPAMQGRSLPPLVQGDVATIREATISGFCLGHDRCIRDETLSLVIRPGDQPDELYNPEEDPREIHNVIDQHRDVAIGLTAKFGPIYGTSIRLSRGL